jgi:hypothetical protein
MAMVTAMVTDTVTATGMDTVTATGMDILRTGTTTIGGMATAAGTVGVGGVTASAHVGA